MQFHLFLLLFSLSLIPPTPTQASEAFLGEIRLFAGNFAPRGWAICDGSLLPIAQNTALFSIIGTTYGGDGRTTFGIPDLRSRVPVGVGAGPGLGNILLGQQDGSEQVTLGVNNLPAHSHAASFNLSTADEGPRSVGVEGITAQTTVDLSGVATRAATVKIPENTCPVEGMGGMMRSVAVETRVKTTVGRAFRCRVLGRCEFAFRQDLVRKRSVQELVLKGSLGSSGESDSSGEARCGAIDDVVVEATGLEGEAVATTTVEGAVEITLGGEEVTGSVNIGSVGGGQGIGVRQPGLGLNYIIAIAGLFPTPS